MTERRGSGGTGYGTMSVAGLAAIAAILSVGWNIFSPKDDIKAVHDEVVSLRLQVERNYESKELAKKDIDRLSAEVSRLRANKVQRDLYEQQLATLQRILGYQRESISKLRAQVTVTWSARDALQSLQQRISELEKAARDAPKAKP